jgi:hypothetical protein
MPGAQREIVSRIDPNFDKKRDMGPLDGGREHASNGVVPQLLRHQNYSIAGAGGLYRLDHVLTSLTHPTQSD